MRANAHRKMLFCNTLLSSRFHLALARLVFLRRESSAPVKVLHYFSFTMTNVALNSDFPSGVGGEDTSSPNPGQRWPKPKSIQH
ncbi:hypothetical protein BDR06DRAFT_324225 [Suillus hirtellus]|nr:hypothetical protein BDR06DRAFT_324225 [Suillus hirtellus]